MREAIYLCGLTYSVLNMHKSTTKLPQVKFLDAYLNK